MALTVVNAHELWVGDWRYRLNGHKIYNQPPMWRLERILRRLSRDRILSPAISNDVFCKMELKYSAIRRARYIPEPIRGWRHLWMYRGQTLTDIQMDKITGFQKRAEFRSRKAGYTVFLWPVGKRHAAIKAYNRRCKALIELKHEAAELQRRVHYEQRNPYDAAKHIRFEKGTAYYAQEIRCKGNLDRGSVSGGEDHSQCSAVA